MKSKKTLLLLILAFVLLLGGAYWAYTYLGQQEAPDQLAAPSTQPTQADPSQTGSAPTQTEPPSAPDFTVYDSQGNPVTLSDYFGKPIVLNFWASWCGPCQMEMPDFQDVYAQLGGEVQFLMINMTDGSRETLQTASGFISENGYTFPVLYDTEFQAANAYRVYSLPTTYFINAQGHVVTGARSAIDADTLQQGIDLIR